MFLKLPIRVPAFIKWVHPPWYVWDKKIKGEKVLYLTFDDGPIPEVTPWVLDTLLQKRIPATFFCIGDNVRKHPQLFKRILAEGHSAGNHTYNHLKGWVTDTDTYIKNTHLAETTMSSVTDAKEIDTPNFPLFRPPYGKIKRKQAHVLKRQGYHIILYRTLAYDWEASCPEDCFKHITDNAQSGDILVYHDSLKAQKNLQGSLEQVIDYYLDKGFVFKAL